MIDAAQIADLCESLMMIAFGASWPMQIIKTVKTKNPMGKSFTFLWLILLGYLAGVASKIISGKLLTAAALCLCINTVMVATDLTLSLTYLRRLKRQQKQA